MNFIKKAYHKIVPIRAREKIRVMKLFFVNKEEYNNMHFNRKHKTCYGKKNKDKRFFVIRRDCRSTGLLSCYVHFLGHLVEMNDKIEKGKIIPVIDMYTQHFALVHNKEDGAFKKNAWNYYFEPISKYTMEEVLESKNVILSYGYLTKGARPFVMGNRFDKKTLTSVLPVHNKYFHIKPELLRKFEKTKRDLFPKKKILGTIIREGYMVIANGKKNKEKSYNGQIIAGHPVQPDIDNLCTILKQKMDEWGCDYLFAEYQTTFVENKLKEVFGTRFLHSNRIRIEIDDLSLDSWKSASGSRFTNTTMVENNMMYLESIYLLSNCNCICSAKSSGAIVATLWNNNKYEHMEIIDNGVY